MRDNRNVYNHTAYINEDYSLNNNSLELVLFSYESFELDQQVVFDWVKNNPKIRLELYRGLSDGPDPVNVCGSVTNIKIDPLNYLVTGTIKPHGRKQGVLLDTIKRNHPITLRMRGLFDSSRNRYKCLSISGLILMAEFSAFRHRNF